MDILVTINRAWYGDNKATTVDTDVLALILNALVAVPAIVEKKVPGK